MFKKFTIKIVSYATVIAIVIMSTASVYARTAMEHEEEGYFEKYLKQEAGTDTGIISSDNEIKLNNQGVFDKEIEAFDSETINEIENSEEVYIFTEVVKQTETEMNGKIETSTCVLNQDEVDELIGELYFEQEEDKELKNAENFFEEIEAEATRVVSVSKTDSTSSSYLKKTLIVSQGSERPYMAHVSFVCTWLKMPEYRYEDSLTVSYTDYAILNRSTDNPISMQASYIEKEIYVSYIWGNTTVLSSNRKYMSTYNSSTGSYNMSLEVLTDNVSDGNNSETVSLLVDLPDDGAIVWNGKDYKQVICTDLQISLGFFIESTKRKKIDIAATYLHTYEKIDWREIVATAANFCLSFIGSKLPGNFYDWTLFIIEVGDTMYASTSTSYSKRVGNFVGSPITGSFYINRVK